MESKNPMVGLSWVLATVPGPHELKKIKSHKNRMTKQLKINKQMKKSPDLLYVHTGMKLAKALTSTERGALGREKPHREIMYWSWF